MVLEYLPLIEREAVEPIRDVEEANELPRLCALVAPAAGRETDADFFGSGALAALGRVAVSVISIPFVITFG
jgi:hypothetical protein